MLEVGVLEEGRVFEAEAEEAVEGDVRGPDEGDCEGELPVEEVACEQEGEWEGEGVGEVVGCRAQANVDEVAEHEEIGREEEDREEEPAEVEMLVGVKSEGEEGGFFEAEEDGGAGEHGLVIWDR